MFTVAKAILEVLTILQELKVKRSDLLLLRLELQSHHLFLHKIHLKSVFCVKKMVTFLS